MLGYYKRQKAAAYAGCEQDEGGDLIAMRTDVYLAAYVARIPRTRFAIIQSCCFAMYLIDTSQLHGDYRIVIRDGLTRAVRDVRRRSIYIPSSLRFLGYLARRIEGLDRNCVTLLTSISQAPPPRWHFGC